MNKRILFSLLFLISNNLYSQCCDSIVIATTQEENYPGEWVNWRQIADTYNLSGEHKAYNYQLWNGGPTWNPIYYSSMNFDLQGHLIDSVVQMDNPLVNKFKFQHKYDAFGMPLSDTVWTWDGISWQYGNCNVPNFCSSSLTQHYHDINNHDSIEINFLYNNGWNLNMRKLSSVNVSGQQVDQIIQNYDTSSNSWINSIHVIKTYNIQGRETYVLTQNWDANLSGWANSEMYTASCDSFGYIISSEFVSVYDSTISTNWFYHDYSTFTYDFLHRLISEHQTHAHHSGSNGITDISYQYNSQGRLSFTDYINESDINYTHRRTFFHYTKTLEAFAGGSKSVCSGTSNRINGDGFGGCGNIYYQWSPASAFNNINIKNPLLNLQNSSWIYLTVTDDSSHSSIDSAFISVITLPSITLANDSINSVLCQGTSIQLSADTTGVTVDGWQLLQDQNLVSGTYSSLTWPITSSGNYSLITFLYGCVDTSNIIQITDAPSVIFTAASSGVTCIGCPDAIISLTPLTGTQPFTYSWTPINGMISGNSIIQLPAGEYIVSAIDAIQCNSYCDTVTINELPTETPESPFDLSSKIYPMPVTNESILQIDVSGPNLSMLIVDMNGNTIRRSPVHQGINKFKKENLSAGLYYYFIMSEQEKISTGKVMVAD